MGGTSRPPKTPKPTDPKDQAQADILVAQEQARLAAEAEARQRAYEEQQRAQERDRWSANVDSAYTAAQGYGQNRFNELGMSDDPYGLMDLYNNELSMRKANIPELGQPGAYFGNDVWDSVSNRVRNTQRNKLTQGFNQFADTGFDTNYFSDTSDDDLLNTLLGNQFTGARENLDRQRARGQLDQNTFDRALLDLNNQRSAGSAKLQDMGLGVLNGYRQQLRDRAQQTKAGITNWDFGSNIDLGSAKSGLDDLANSFRTRMEGDITNAVGTTELFDIPTLLAKARSRTGLTNTSSTGSGGSGSTLGQTDRRMTSTQGAF